MLASIALGDVSAAYERLKRATVPRASEDVAQRIAAIEAVFGAEPVERRIDFRIADRALDGESPLAADKLAVRAARARRAVRNFFIG